MNDRLERLFAPEALKKRWETKPGRKAPSAAHWKTQMESTPLGDALSGVSRDILSCIKGEKRQKVLSAMLESIRLRLDELASPDREDPPQDAEVFAVIGEIQQMEDLIEAYLGDQGEL